MFKKFFGKAWVVLAIMLTLTVVFSMTAFADEGEENGEPVAIITGGEYLEFYSFEELWTNVFEYRKSKFTHIQLLSDWVAPDGYFHYVGDNGKEVGTDKGRLIVKDDDYYYYLTIDLNGHKIDRNLTEPTENGQVFKIENGDVKFIDTSAEKTGMITGANNIGDGGAFYLETDIWTDVNLVIEGVTITGNYATNGAGIFWDTDGDLCLNSANITGNYATGKGAGLYATDWGDVYFGGTTKVKDNFIKGTSTNSNVYLEDSDVDIRNCMSQAYNGVFTVPYYPLAEGAEIGISVEGNNTKLSSSDSAFAEDSFKYFFPDSVSHFVRSTWKADGNNTVYDLYYTSWQHESKRAPRVTSVSSVNDEFVKGIDFDYEKQIIKITVANDKQYYFGAMSLNYLISCEFNDPSYYLARFNEPANMIDGEAYRITADNSTYVLCEVYIEPEGGEWQEEQDSEGLTYKAMVFNDNFVQVYDDIGRAWAAAIEQSMVTNTTFRLYSDWVAADGEFYAENEDGSEYGTDDGYLVIDDENINLTVDLNGYTIDRNLDEPTSNGYVFYIGEGKLSILDYSEAQTGKITGGNTTGDGGVFYVDRGLLAASGGYLDIYGGTFEGNHADGCGGVIYSDSGRDVQFHGGTMKNNTAEYGGAIAANNEVRIKGGLITENYAEYGGAVYAPGCIIVQGGTIKGNTAKYGGGIYAKDKYYGEIYMYGGTIEENYAEYGGGIFIANQLNMVSGNVKIINNEAKYDGGGIYSEGSATLDIGCGEISGNKAVNGAGVYWNGEYYCLINDAIVKNNEASGLGGGVYVVNGKRVHVGGLVEVWDNTSSLGKDNIMLAGENTSIAHGTGNPFGTAFSEGARVGVRAEVVKGERIISSTEGFFEEDCTDYIFIDDDSLYMECVADAAYNGYKLTLKDDSAGCMFVDVEGEETVSFKNYGNGWAYAMKKSLTKPTTVTLGADWVARDGMFYCIDEENGSEYGSNNGRLHLNDNHVITIDLNGHKIDRNLTEAKDDGQVFSLTDYDVKLTIKDSVGGGKITGAYNTGDGGAFYMHRGSLYIEGGEITGNKAKNGAGIFAASQNNLCITGGQITGNEATDNGGGIYGTDWGKMYFGGDVQIYDNSGKGSENNNLYLADSDVDVNRAAGQNADIPDVPFTDKAVIGISAYDTEDLISGSDSRFQWTDYLCFFTDSSRYYIQPVYKSEDGNHASKLYIRPVAETDEMTLAFTSVAIANYNLVSNVTLDIENQVITITAKLDNKHLFANKTHLEDLIQYETTEDVYTMSSDFYNHRDWTAAPSFTFLLEDEAGNYRATTINIEWVCTEHEDEDGNYVCDHCGEYTLTEVKILSYSLATKSAKIFVPEDGSYTVIFTSCYKTPRKLGHLNMISCELKRGINTVYQETTNWNLLVGDKLMVWDMTTLTPACEAFVREE